MKVLSKEQVIKRKDVEHTKTERNVLRRIRHPFVVQLHFAFQTGAWRCCSIRCEPQNDTRLCSRLATRAP
jgi:murein endopeptidase